MTESLPNTISEVESRGDCDTAESRRNAARRRFLTGSAAAGTGTLIVTFHHRRALAGAKTVMASSVAVSAHRTGQARKTTPMGAIANPDGPAMNITEYRQP